MSIKPISRQACVVCQKRLAVRARVAWTVGRGRLHEECLPNVRLSAAGERLPARILPALLQRIGMHACGACLALSLGVSLLDARDLMQRADGAHGLKLVQMRCASCGRHVDTLTSCGVIHAVMNEGPIGCPDVPEYSRRDGP